jgi:hypothetical protein
MEGDKHLYLHQWQFGMSASARAVIGDFEGHDKDTRIPIPGCLHNDLLGGIFAEFGGSNPYQYLFCGPANTWTGMHSDPGGLAILIAPITGIKEVILVHRDDRHLIGDTWKDEASLKRGTPGTDIIIIFFFPFPFSDSSSSLFFIFFFPPFFSFLLLLFSPIIPRSS